VGVHQVDGLGVRGACGVGGRTGLVRWWVGSLGGLVGWSTPSTMHSLLPRHILRAPLVELVPLSHHVLGLHLHLLLLLLLI
jgi:hypothetical protein